MATQSTSIAFLLNQIKNDKLVLPDLQRDFVWEEDQIRLLFDSLMRDYPFGSLLVWQTQYHSVAYRRFVSDFQRGMTFSPMEKGAGVPLQMVLDGQQRLQSLLIGMSGTIDGRRLYFNVASGPQDMDPDVDAPPGGYRFEFRRDDEPNRPKRLVRVADILQWSNRFEEAEIDRVIAEIGLEGDEANRARRNMRRLRAVFQQSNLVPLETIDDEAVNEGQARSINEILEIFVRVNSGGTRLSRSDLMFSLIKTQWSGARRHFDRISEVVDPTGQLGIDKDFVIRGLLMTADVPVVFDVEAIGRHWPSMQSRFEAFEASLKVAVDFCQDPDIRIATASLLNPIASLYPIIYFASFQKSHSIPVSSRPAVRAFLHFTLFNGFLKGKSPEARIRYLREVLIKHKGQAFPLEELLGQIRRRQTHHQIETNSVLLNWNQRLALSIVQPKVCRDTLSWQARAEVDHIFPQSKYREAHPEIVDDIGNMAFLGKLRNIVKSDVEPEAYFADTPDEELRRDYLIERELLHPDKFPEFVRARRERILAEAKIFLGR